MDIKKLAKAAKLPKYMHDTQCARDSLAEFAKLVVESETLCDMNRLRAIEEAARNLCEVKGRHHSEIAMRRLIEAVNTNAKDTPCQNHP